MPYVKNDSRFNSNNTLFELLINNKIQFNNSKVTELVNKFIQKYVDKFVKIVITHISAEQYRCANPADLYKCRYGKTCSDTSNDSNLYNQLSEISDTDFNENIFNDFIVQYKLIYEDIKKYNPSDCIKLKQEHEQNTIINQTPDLNTRLRNERKKTE